MRIFSWLLLLLFVMPLTAAQRETRAVWFTTAWGLDFPSRIATSASTINRQKGELVRKLDSLQRLNINLIFFQTRIRADLAYPSTIEPWHYVFGGKTGVDPGYDLLSFAIEESHKRGMEFHAWMVCLPIGTVRAEREKGNLALSKRRADIAIRHSGEWFLNPGNPATANYLAHLAQEITKRYPIDGIHLDYIRYPDRPQGYPDSDLFKRSGAAKLEDWRRDNITNVVSAIYDSVKSVDANVRVSCAVIGRYSNGASRNPGWRAYDDVYQDPVEWIKRGKCDFIVPMLYYNTDRFADNLKDWVENVPPKRVVAGLYTSMIDPKEKNWNEHSILDQIALASDLGLAGSAHFRAMPLVDNVKGLSSMLRVGRYSERIDCHNYLLETPIVEDRRDRVIIDGVEYLFDNSALAPMFDK
ncbi:MAG: glycoside hydrolase family 10 protein [Bacteroidales bacterium]